MKSVESLKDDAEGKQFITYVSNTDSECIDQIN